MTFKNLSNIIRKYKERQPDNTAIDPIQKELEESRALLERLRTSHNIAYQRRKDRWFARHPENKYFEPTLEETYQDTEPVEWHWYFWEYMKQTPEQRYHDEKNQNHGFGHGGIDGGVDSRECKPGCRFHPEEGRIEDIEVLYYYEKYQGFKEALASWNTTPS